MSRPDVHSLGLRYLQVDDDDDSHLLPQPHDNAAERRTRIFSTGSKRAEVVSIIGESPIKHRERNGRHDNPRSPQDPGCARYPRSNH